MTATVSPEAQLAFERLWKASQGMVYSLAKTASGQMDATVLEFQTAWNSFAPLFPAGNRVPSGMCAHVGEAIPFKLVEDGMFGPRTSTALTLWATLPAVAPCRASGMPTWYAQNRDAVDAWVRPDVVADNVEITGPTPAANTVLREAQVASTAQVTASADATVANELAAQTPVAPMSLCAEMLPPGPDRDACLAAGFGGWVRAELKKIGPGEFVYFNPSGRPVGIREGVVPSTYQLCYAFGGSLRTNCVDAGFEAFVRDSLARGYVVKLWAPQAAASAAQEVVEVVEAPETVEEVVTTKTEYTAEEALALPADFEGGNLPVVSVPRTGIAPLLAVGGGAVVLGGVLWAFTRKRGARRRVA